MSMNRTFIWEPRPGGPQAGLAADPTGSAEGETIDAEELRQRCATPASRRSFGAILAGGSVW
jgi:hypothetical protein